MKLPLFLVFSWLIVLGYSQRPCNLEISGQVLDIESGSPLPFATVKILGSEKGVISDSIGFFKIVGICEREVDLEIQFVGYKKVIHHHDFHHGDPTIYLASDENLLESVIIEKNRSEEQQSLAIQRKEISSLSKASTSIGDLTEEISGVSTLKTGSNIVKPMIHGLHSNRVLVVNDGVRHAYQVWGQEHAPEIDPSHVDRIEVVKGAATVKYGPEALGGVILYNSKRLTFDQPINGSVSSSYQTNGNSLTSQFNVGQGLNRFAWNVGAYGTYQGDLEAPNYTLSNTGKREYGGSFNTLYHRPKFDLQVSGSYFEQELGILRGSLVGNLVDLQNAIERSVPSPTFPRTYDIQNPKQETEHGLLKTNLSLFLGDHVFKVQYAIQRNIRREFDVRRGELNNRPVIDLELISHTLETEWIQPTKGRWNGSTGVQLFNQNSVNEPGSNPVNFVPDYDVLNVGLFTVQSYDLDEMVLELGARFDIQSLSVADTIRERTIYSNNVDYSNATFTIGVRKEINENLTFFSNVGSAWRPPNVAELYSFGYHFSRIQFGLWRYELEPSIRTPIDRVFDETDRAVPAEKGIKWVSGLELTKGKTISEFIFYLNHINDYIFLRPYGITTNIAGTFPYFLYDQTNVLFIGSDWDLRFNHSESLTSEVKISYVYAVERENQQPLIEIPPLNIQYGLDKKNGKWSYGLTINYTARQWNAPPAIEPIRFQENDVEINRNEIFDFMAPPDAFLLVGAKVGYKHKHWNIEVNTDNISNTSYRIYTDRLRYFSEAPGRNVGFALEFKF